MPKNLVLCCDGTANQLATDHTNVAKLFGALEKSDRQLAYYHAGLGTMEAPGAITPIARRVTRAWGKAFGLGLSDDVCDAYRFLMRHYEDDDRVFLFGFSRGAYTARVLASLLHMCGLLAAGNEALVPYLLRILTSISKAKPPFDTSRLFGTADWALRHAARTTCPVYFCGAWDTVSSVGWIESPLRVPFSATNPSIGIGRHAIAIDERRAFFRTNLWRPATEPGRASGPRDLKQVWFAGAHADVGGGYVEGESALAKISLGWMVREAKAAGLLVLEQETSRILGAAPPFVAPNADGQMHNELKHPGWWIPEFLLKRHWNWTKGRETHRMNLFRRRTIPEGAAIHKSVFERAAYRPALPKVYSIES